MTDRDMVPKAEVLDIYAELYDEFDGAPGIIKVLNKVYDKLERLQPQKPVVSPTVDGWISVKDRLPSEHDSLFANHPHLSKHMWTKESDDVIVYVVFPDGTGRATEGRLRDGKWHTKISPTLESVVTHWMPMPEPPKEGNENDKR